jgi:hypothetical protein
MTLDLLCGTPCSRVFHIGSCLLRTTYPNFSNCRANAKYTFLKRIKRPTTFSTTTNRGFKLLAHLHRVPNKLSSLIKALLPASSAETQALGGGV